MKIFFIILSLFPSFVCSQVLDYQTFTNQFDSLICAIGTVEGNNNPRAIGDSGRSIGQFQIQKNCWLDVKDKIGGQYEDCFDPAYSKKVMYFYFVRYCPDGLNNRNHEKLSRIWNGGPNGHKKESTLKYWKRIKIALDKR